jgi:effector-binding domain-containing protein
MKFLKLLGGLIVVVILIVVFLGFIMPKEYSVEKTVNIDAPKQVIWKNVNNFKAMDQWSPWREMDPNQKTEYIGESGEVGSMTKWEGDPNTVGTGSQELMLSTPFERIETKLRFMVPWEAENDVYVSISPNENGYSVAWGFSGKMDFPMNVFLPLMGIEEGVGNDFTKGLTKLKEICETQSNLGKYKDWEVNLVELPIKYFVAVRDTIKMQDMSNFYAQNFGKLYGSITQNGTEMSGQPSGLIYLWDEENNTTVMAAAIPVVAETNIQGFESVVFEGGKALQIDYYGDYEGSGDAHWAMDECIQDYGFEVTEPVIEEYITDPMEEPDTSKWLTRITYKLK